MTDPGGQGAAGEGILLDANLLIALSVADHIHREPATTWLSTTDFRVATCPITQGALVRTWLRVGGTAASAKQALTALAQNPRHAFWPDDVGFVDVALDGVVGHRQVTDAYLAQLARNRGARLATLDRGLAAAHPDVALLVPAG